MAVLAGQLVMPPIASGGDRLCLEIVRRWRDADVTFFAPPAVADELRADLDGRFAPIRCPGIARSGITRDRPALVPLYFAMSGWGLARALAREAFDVVYATGDFAPNIIPAALYKRRRPDAIFAANIFHLNAPPGRRRANSASMGFVSFAFQRASLSLIRRRADVVFLLNRGVRDDLVRLGFDPARLDVRGAGVDVARIRSARRGSRGFDVVWFGRMCPTKGIDDVPEILERIVRRHPDARLAMIGTHAPKWLAPVLEGVRRRGLEDRFAFLGYLPYEEVFGILKASKVFISTSYEEGWGMTICEALACGIPAVAYDLPVFREIFASGVRGVPLGDAAKLADEVVRLLDDEGERRRLGEAGRRDMERYAFERVAERELARIAEAGR
ncbi:MAG: glycosyltransferase family 4 protein [Planctomycetes bacterium]|nr:glycosyltransferase family 4 protein [Planctomycetota bacterium]